MDAQETTLGDLVALFYEEYLTLYGDEELAAVAAATTINEMLLDQYITHPEDEELT